MIIQNKNSYNCFVILFVYKCVVYIYMIEVYKLQIFKSYQGILFYLLLIKVVYLKLFKLISWNYNSINTVKALATKYLFIFFLKAENQALYIHGLFFNFHQMLWALNNWVIIWISDFILFWVLKLLSESTLVTSSIRATFIILSFLNKFRWSVTG